MTRHAGSGDLEVLPQRKQVGNHVDPGQFGCRQRVSQQLGDLLVDNGNIECRVVRQSGGEQLAGVVTEALDRSLEPVEDVWCHDHQASTEVAAQGRAVDPDRLVDEDGRPADESRPETEATEAILAGAQPRCVQRVLAGGSCSRRIDRPLRFGEDLMAL